MSSNDILLVNPNRMDPPVPPIALDLLASALDNEGFSVDILDLNLEPRITTVIEEFSKKKYLAVGVSIRNIDNVDGQNSEFYLYAIKRIINILKKAFRTYIIIGGSGFSSMPKEIFKYLKVDLGIIGDGERVFPQFVKKLLTNEYFLDLPGLVYEKDGTVQYNSPKYVNLKVTGKVSRRFVNNSQYYQIGGLGSIQTKRGCTKSCIYCLDPICSGRRIRFYSFNCIKQQIKELMHSNIFSFYICDSEFNIPLSHAEYICEEIIKERWGERFKWYTYMTPNPFSDKLAQLLRDSGCQGVAFTAENFNQKMLQNLGKDYTKEDIEKCIRICEKYQIKTMVHLLFGGPGETKETIKESIMFCRKNMPDVVRVSLGIRIYPQTELARIVENEGFNTENKNLKGAIKNNRDMVKPVFYLSEAVGSDVNNYIRSLIQSDRRFLYCSPYKQAGKNKHSFADPMKRVINRAIKSGFRGPYWAVWADINKFAHGGKYIGMKEYM